MQRGAAKYDRSPPDKTPDYSEVKPQLRKEDMAHLGLTEDRFDQLALRLREKVIGYAKAGFKKPAQVSHLLNKEKIRTGAGSEWNPRLVYFLLAKIYSREAERAVARIVSPSMPKSMEGSITRSKNEHRNSRPKAAIAPVMSAPLTTEEMGRRLEALRAHFNER
ncbi:hypothetical protein [Rhizobium hidalgonense]|uniref:hypothetical protein n=1 Tax=Rhizobium hidalgonense TaxID=1538159 RepID=UPI001106CCD3|nr:hypothetical protein [Rhizobium hidalgonense]QKK24724.1 hypothetical protein FFM81_015890 [Rhizobium hidalgonense]